jgi:cysteine-rich secretory family protein
MRQRSATPALAGLILLLIGSAAGPASARGLDDAVLDEINYARTHPREYARELARHDAAWQPGDRYASDNAQDVEEAIDFLMRQSPLPPLRRDERLSEAAYDHASTQGARGQLGHTGVRGETLGQRLQRRGMWAGMSAENISYGYDDPSGVVRQLVVDSGVPNRGHRLNIFSRGYQAAGVGCARHATYGAMCVIDFAGAIVQR